MDRLRARVPGGLPLYDVALAAALCVLALGGLLSGDVTERPLALTVPIAAASTVAIAFRTRFPLLVTAVVAALAVAQALLTDGPSQTLWSLVVFLLVAYTVAAECDEGPALLGLGAALGGQFVCEWSIAGSDYPFDALVFGGAWLFGRGTRSWRKRATYSEQHRHDLARIAVGEERVRIARELHDVIAHSLSVIAVQADAAEAALTKDPGRAAEPMRAIRTSARDALGDMRQLLHVLRAEDTSDAALAPARGAADVPQLVARMRDSGLPLTVELGQLGALSSGTDLAVYRIVQEGLTNVRKHAGGVPTSVRVVREDGRLYIEIVNAASSARRAIQTDPSTGLGLIGIRERVRAAGGEVQSGPTVDGGFRLAAWLPSHDRRGAVTS